MALKAFDASRVRKEFIVSVYLELNFVDDVRSRRGTFPAASVRESSSFLVTPVW